MIKDIMNAISIKLHEVFGDAYEINMKMSHRV